MSWFLYNLVLFVGGAVMLPSLYLKMKRRGGYRANFENRFGRYSPELAARLADFGGKAILIHAVSVGEVGVAMQFIEAMRAEDGSARFVISTTSSTGWREAEKRLDPRDALVYLPVDFPRFVRRALDAIRPRAFLIVETEIWPNMIRACAERGIPMAIINGRLSDKTAPAYRRLRFLFGPALRCIETILVQSELDERRFLDAGADPHSLTVTGSFKFDVARRNPVKEEELGDFLRRLDFAPPRQILLGASTWEGEEKLLLDCYGNLRKKHPELRLVLVPRHFERAEAVVRQIEEAGFRAVRRSACLADSSKVALLTGEDVLLMDTTGEVMGLYPYATLAVVGRTFCSFGGQNMIEPCLCGVATVVGPNTQNFRPVMSDLLAAKALLQLKSADSLESALGHLLVRDAERMAMGGRAARAVESRRGVVGRSVICVRDALNG